MPLENCPVVYLDSQAALQYAYQNGLKEGTVIRTNAPEVLLNPPVNFVVEEISTKTNAFIVRWMRHQGTFLKQIYESAKALGYDHPSAVVIVLQMYHTIPLTRWATSLETSDFYKKRAVIVCSKSDPPEISPFETLLQANPQLCILSYEQTVTEKPEVFPGRWALMRVSSWEILEFVFWKKLWSFLPKALSRGIVLLGKDSSLLRETACHLARKGYALVTLSNPVVLLANGNQENRYLPLLKALHADVAEWFGDLMPDQAQIALNQYIDQNISLQLTRYASFQQAWEQHLVSLPASWNIKILCHSSLSSTKWAGLYPLCHQRGIYIASFEHGHSRALNQRHDPHYWLLKEELFCDHLFTFDQKAAEHSQNNPFSVAKIDAAGIPNDFLKKSCYRVSGVPKCEIIYTKMLSGGYWRSGGIAEVTDFQDAQFEQRLIKEVFAKIPHTVLYKPYPTERYPIEDGTRDQILKHPNIYYLEKQYDLKFLFAHASLIVTLHPTSTLGFCFAQKKPLVFLYLPKKKPLVPSLVPLFEKAFFFFDYREPNFFQHLKTFLSQPVAEIEKKWQEKLKGQEELWIRNFGCDPYTKPSKAGKRAAKQILRHL